MAQKEHGHAGRLPQCPERLGRQPVSQRKDGTQGAHEVTTIHHVPIMAHTRGRDGFQSSNDVRQRTRNQRKKAFCTDRLQLGLRCCCLRGVGRSRPLGQLGAGALGAVIGCLALRLDPLAPTAQHDYCVSNRTNALLLGLFAFAASGASRDQCEHRLFVI